MGHTRAFVCFARSLIRRARVVLIVEMTGCDFVEIAPSCSWGSVVMVPGGLRKLCDVEC